MNYWTDEKVAELKNLCNAGLSATQIAARMRGITWNAVIGKCMRLGIRLNSHSQIPRVQPLVRPPRIPRAEPKPPVERPAPLPRT